jgi:ribosome-binding ATPase YchF (GTP1/OBG family)
VALVDVAGLVPGASEGRGRGNAFLADLANCDVLIQVVDAAGSTDLEGQFRGASATTEEAVQSVRAEIEFLEHELDAWIGGLLEDGWNRGVRRVQAEGEKGLTSFIQERLSGLGATSTRVAQGMMNFNAVHQSEHQPWDWDATSLHLLGKCMRAQLFPIVYAANKMDIAPPGVLTSFADRTMVACMADMELALRRATSSELIDYQSGSSTFELRQDATLNDAQRKALDHMNQRLQSAKGTGLAKLLDEVLFDQLHHIVVYPVQDETHWVDGDGRVLPDALVVPLGLHAKALAGRVHTDLEAGFIRGVDGRTRRVVGADHEMSDGDVLKIHAKS